MKEIFEIINSIDLKNPNINPTVIYNEGWMTRLLVYHSIKEKIKLGIIDFSQQVNRKSDAKIESPFLKAEKHREG
jgi:hypothetical protein